MNPVKDEEQQTLEASMEEEALTHKLMEKVIDPVNLNRAYKRVKANKGAAGTDGMTVNELYAWIVENKEEFLHSLVTGMYQPKPVLGVEIPKAGKGGIRQLGIPCVVDRLVQQAIHQILEPILDPTFSDSSYGFRPGHSAHKALRQAQRYVKEGRQIVVDIDLESFFDRVNHDILMSRLARRIHDKRLLRIIRRFLEAGMMKHGTFEARKEGVPQGGPLSPLMANLLLDDFDKELERRGHAFCRYADDSNIYVRSQRAGERVMVSMRNFLEGVLRLKINQHKSGCSPVDERQFLGYEIKRDGKLVIAKQSILRVQEKLRKLTRRTRGISLEKVITEVNKHLQGWINYFRLTDWPSDLRNLDAWLRRKLRCYRLKQRKRSRSIARFLMSLGVQEHSAWPLAASTKGWWRLSKSIPVHHAMNAAWFDKMGVINLSRHRVCVNQLTETAVCDIARTVV